MADQQAETAHPPPENNTTAESTATTKPPVPNRRNPHPIPVYQRPNRAGWNASGQAGFFGLWCVICYVVLFAIEDFAGDDKWTFWFTLLFLWRYARFVINLFGWFIYRPARIPRNPYYGPEDVTVILPTIDPGGEDFAECLRTCCENNPHSIFVVTAGNRLPATEAAVQPFQAEFPQINFLVDCSPVASKRAQVALMIPRVTTAITVMLDDHVFWKRNFLRAMLAPFDADDAVGMVGTNKAVRRLPNLGFNRRFWNLIGAMYLYRHNFEVRAANAIDGGAFVISARTCALRTEIIQLPEFLEGYANEMFFFGLFGPLNPDDDNYNTRFVVKKGWKLKFQYTDDAEITTTIGVVPPYAKKFLGQATRWARTTWRSNPRSLFVERAVWAYNPISVYTVFISALTNFAIPTDLCLYYFFHWSELYTTRLRGWVPTRNHGTVLLLGWMLFAKLVKQSGYWWRHPRDFLYFPLAIGFGYFHTFIKFYAMVTFWDHAWTGRNLKAVDAGAGPGNAAGMGGDDN
ncbi:glycosyltransferase family 2 protein, partial [Cladorrhinum sp. PSN259]